MSEATRPTIGSSGSSRADRGARRFVAALSLVVVCAAAGACSLPADGETVPIADDELNEILVNPTALATTTTTATSTTTTTTLAPSATTETTAVDAASTTTSTTTTTTTTTTPPSETAVTVYYPLATTQRMRPVERAVSRARADEQPLTALAAEVVRELEFPVGIAELGLRTSVRPGLVEQIVVDRGTAALTLDDSVLDGISENEERRAVAQLVLSLTSTQLSGVGTIGLVVFETASGPYEVFVPAFNGTSDGEEPLSYSDFARLVSSTPGTGRTTSTTTPAFPDAPESAGAPSNDDVPP